MSDDGTIFCVAIDVFWFHSCDGPWAKRFVITEYAPAHLWLDPKYGKQYLCRPLSATELDVASRIRVLTDKQTTQIMRKILSSSVESVKRQDVELLCSPYCLKQYKVKKITLGDKTIYQPDKSGEVIVYRIALTAFAENCWDSASTPCILFADISFEGHIFRINAIGFNEEKILSKSSKNETGCPGICKYGALTGNQNAKSCKFAKDVDCLCWFPLSEEEIEEALLIACKEIYRGTCVRRNLLCSGLFKLPDTQKTTELYFYN